MHKIRLMVLLAGWLVALPLHADESVTLSEGQVVYVPAYSHIYIGDRESPRFLLAITLSIRNIDPNHQISITTVDYYETQGELLKSNLSEPVLLKPLGATRYIIPQRDDSGGSGANFIVKWTSEEPVNPPIIEAIMVGRQVHQAVAFTSRGQAIVTSKK